MERVPPQQCSGQQQRPTDLGALHTFCTRGWTHPCPHRQRPFGGSPLPRAPPFSSLHPGLPKEGDPALLAPFLLPALSSWPGLPQVPVLHFSSLLFPEGEGGAPSPAERALGLLPILPTKQPLSSQPVFLGTAGPASHGEGLSLC